MNNTASLPRSAQELNPETLGRLLSAGRRDRTAEIESVDVQEVGVDVGFVGRAFRCRLTYAADSEAGPVTVIVKMGTDDPGLNQVFRDFGLYEREVRFYQELRDSTPIPVPGCFFAATDDGTGDHLLILEDLAPAVPGDPLSGSSTVQAQQALDLAASLHARWWNDDQLEGLEWLPTAAAPRIVDGIAEMFAPAWSAFAKNVGPDFPRYALHLGDRLTEELPTVLERLSEPPRTLVHGDFQLGNLFYDATGEVAAVADWQVIIHARGAMDVAHFIARSLTPGDRRAAERDLILHYCRSLAAAGGVDYTAEDCWTDYRLAVLSQFGLGILLSYGLAASATNARHDASRDKLSLVVGGRLLAALEDLDVAELLPKRPLLNRIRSALLRG